MGTFTTSEVVFECCFAICANCVIFTKGTLRYSQKIPGIFGQESERVNKRLGVSCWLSTDAGWLISSHNGHCRHPVLRRASSNVFRPATRNVTNFDFHCVFSPGTRIYWCIPKKTYQKHNPYTKCIYAFIRDVPFFFLLLVLFWVFSHSVIYLTYCFKHIWKR